MNREEFHRQRRFIIIGTLMAVISLAFLYYMGNSLVAATKRYKEQTIEITLTNR